MHSFILFFILFLSIFFCPKTSKTLILIKGNDFLNPPTQIPAKRNVKWRGPSFFLLELKKQYLTERRMQGI